MFEAQRDGGENQATCAIQLFCAREKKDRLQYVKMGSAKCAERTSLKNEWSTFCLSENKFQNVLRGHL
jgi:hypothetical protein